MHLRQTVHRRNHSDIMVRDPLRRRGDHVHGWARGQTATPKARGIQVVYAIPIVAPLLVRAEGPHCRLRVWPPRITTE